MGNLNTELLIDELRRQNPWWLEKTALAHDPQTGRRDVYGEILDKVTKNNLIIAVTGLRRIGKTTLVKQIINHLLSQTDYPQKIAYFSFEEATLMAIPELLERIILYQIKRNPTGQLYFFLDEIQYVNLWNAILKKYFDRDQRLKFVITGSSSLFIKTQAQETLAGRILETVMHPLGFGEYLRLIKRVNLPKTEIFSYEKLIPYKELLKEEFYRYLVSGEFPYLSRLVSFGDQKQYVLDWVIGKIVENDLPKLRRFVHGGELLNLTSILISGSGQLVELQNLAYDLGIDRKTLSAYLDLLEKTRLIGTIFNYRGSFRTRNIRQRKIYSTSVNAVAVKNTSGIHSESFSLKLGQIVENFVFNYLRQQKETRLYFWRQREKEVDFIIETTEKKLPLEVKYQNQIRNDDLKNLLYLCQKKRLNEALVVTKDSSDTKSFLGTKLVLLPAYFLV